MPEESLLSTAYQFIQQGETQTAERLLTGLIRKEPRSEAAWLLLAACKSLPEEKEKCLEFVAEINPENGAALQALSEMLAGRDADELILQAFEDWQIQEVEKMEEMREELAAEIPEEIDGAAIAVEEEATASLPRQVRTVWLWLAIILLAAAQAVSWLRIRELQQALAAAQVRIQSLQTILTEYIVQIELLQELVR
ncbi:MAG: hypothetical protein K8R77_00945 [Anaerolineaceae bacterium]|nr:hypothetical protein [Anaerolineaceae bacterium]